MEGLGWLGEGDEGSNDGRCGKLASKSTAGAAKVWPANMVTGGGEGVGKAPELRACCWK